MPGVAWHGKCSRFLLHDTKLHFCHSSDCVLYIARNVLFLAQSNFLPSSSFFCLLHSSSISPDSRNRQAVHTVKFTLCGRDQQPTLAPPANQPWASSVPLLLNSNLLLT